MLTNNLRKDMMESMDKICKAADTIGDITEFAVEDHLIKARISAELASIYSALKDINSILLTDILTTKVKARD